MIKSVFRIHRKKEKNHRNQIFSFVLLPILVTASIAISGCVTTAQTADVVLTNMTHQETPDALHEYKSMITFSVQNIGDAAAKDVTLVVRVYDNNEDEQYNTTDLISSQLDSLSVISHSIFIYYDTDDVSFDLNITVRWSTGEHSYTQSFIPQPNNYANVQLDYFTHHELAIEPNLQISQVILTFRNTGDIPAENVSVTMHVLDQDNTEHLSQTDNITSRLPPGAIITHEVNISYDQDDIILDLNISIQWSTGRNVYSKSFVPQIIEEANVQLENVTHFERNQIFVGPISTVNFILQNRGNTIAEDVRIQINAQDQNGNSRYSRESTVALILMPGEITVFTISVPYDVDDERLDFTIITKWNGGENSYTKSFIPELLS